MLLYLTFNSACYMTQIFMKFWQNEWISIHIKHKKLLPTYSTIPPIYVKDFLSLLPPGDWYWVCTRSSVCSNCCGKRKRKIDGLLVSFVSRSSSKKNTKKNTLHFGPKVTQVPLLIRFWSRRLALSHLSWLPRWAFYSPIATAPPYPARKWFHTLPSPRVEEQVASVG